MIKWILRIGLPLGILAVGLGVTACTLATGALAKQRDLATLADALLVNTEVFEPKGPGPHPVVIYMHGCKRRQSHVDLWGEALSSHGYAMVAIDSFAPRGMDDFTQQYGVCTGLTLLGRERSADLWAALRLVLVGDDPAFARLDRDRIGAIGFSHGGWSVMDMMTQWSRDQLPDGLLDTGLSADFAAVSPGPRDLDALVLFYPWCKAFSLTQEVGAWERIPPTHFIRPTVDVVVGTTGCDDNIASLTQGARGTGQGPVTDVILESQGHAFDEPDRPFIPYEPETTRKAIASALEFLDGAL